MGVTRFFSEVDDDFEVLGEREGDWESFRKNVEYEGFLVRRKNKQLSLNLYSYESDNRNTKKKNTD
jgi:hypothetical protein